MLLPEAPRQKRFSLLRAAELLLQAGEAPDIARSTWSRTVAPSTHTARGGLLIYAQAPWRSSGRQTEAEDTLRGPPQDREGGGSQALVSHAHLELARLHLSRDEIFEAFDAPRPIVQGRSEETTKPAFLLGLVALDLDDETHGDAGPARRVTAPPIDAPVGIEGHGLVPPGPRGAQQGRCFAAPSRWQRTPSPRTRTTLLRVALLEERP